MIYGYCRISTKKQSVERQIRNIKSRYSYAVIVQEEYTGTSASRPEWDKLYKKLKRNDTVIFDSVSRMSRNADDGISLFRTKEGIETARLDGKQIGMPKGSSYETKRSKEAKSLIIKYSNDFDGSLSDKDCMKLIGVANNSFYKYKKELK